MNTAMSACEAADQWQHTLLLLHFTNELDMDALPHEFRRLEDNLSLFPVFWGPDHGLYIPNSLHI